MEAQQWLEENYPNKKTEEIHINQQLEGLLDCSGYDNLYKISISLQVDSSKFQIKKGSYDGKETKIIPCIPAQEWLEQNYPKNGTCVRENERDWGDNKINNYNKTRDQITKLKISQQNLEGKLDLSDFTNLEELDCRYNKLTSLNISNCDKLKTLSCSENHLTQITYPTNPEELTELEISNNNFSQDLSVFSQFKNLEKLYIYNNHFTGSLEPLKDLNKLEKLYISNTDIDHGLEYLSKSVKYLDCSFTNRPEARVSDIYEELQPFGFDRYGYSDLIKWREVKWDKKLSLTISPLLPPQLIRKESEFFKYIKDKIKENRLIQEVDYKEIHFNQWEKSKKNELPTKELPTKLYNIQEDQIEETKGRKDIENYAILSYVWGKERKLIELFNKTNIFDTQYREKLNPSGYKSLYKAIQACGLKDLEINYIWIDQLCIDQSDKKDENGKTDKDREIPKMRQYYSNADYTLISINNEIGDLSNIDMMDVLEFIISSRWFTRSWTYQEGWLSKYTIFMFDDKLIDGRAMAGTWALNQLKYSGEGGYSSRREFQKGTKKIATPVGWTYYRDGYTEEDKVTMTLNQALKGIKNRKRFLPIDGIYSILGLLPYGSDKDIIIDYSKDNTPEKALENVMKVATWNRYAEPIAWHGTSNTTSNLCWMPKVYEDGSTSIEGGMEIKGRDIDFKEERNIQLNFIDTYTITEADSNLNKIEGGFEIESGLYQKVVTVKGKNDETEIKVPLLGIQDTLNSAKVGKFLLVFRKEEYRSNKPFALLVEDTGKTANDYYKRPIYHRLGLVELGNEKLQGGENWITIGNKSQELQAQIQVPPK